MPVWNLGDVLIVGRVSVVAGRVLLLAAMKAGATGDSEGYDDTLPFLERRTRSDLDHLAHEFMAEDIARLHGRDVAVIEMKVRAADCSRSDLDNRVARIDDF